MTERQFNTSVQFDDGESVHVEQVGSGDALLLIQGLGYATWAWRLQRPLADRVRLVAFDNRGSGRSSKPAGPYSIDQLAADAAAVAESTDSEPVDVLGVSMGGYIAVTLALRRPDLVRSLILVSTSAGGPGHEPVPEATMTAWMEASGLPPAEYARRTMALSFSPGWAEEQAQEYERWLSERLEYPTPTHCWQAQFDACMRFLDAGVSVENIDVPTLVVHGDADRVVPVSNGEALASRIPGARLAVLEGRGHLGFIEDPAAFNRLVADFLAEVARR